MKLVMINETTFETMNHLLSFLYSLKTIKGFENIDVVKLMKEKIIEIDKPAINMKNTMLIKEDYDN